MKIHRTIRQTAKELSVELECEHCGDRVHAQGYDSAKWFETIPTLKCRNKKCLKVSPVENINANVDGKNEEGAAVSQ